MKLSVMYVSMQVNYKSAIQEKKERKKTTLEGNNPPLHPAQPAVATVAEGQSANSR